MRDRERRRRVIQQAELAVHAIATHPLPGTTNADLDGRGRLRHRPCLINDSLTEQPALIQAERRVSVQIHPVSSLGLRCLAALSLQGGPDEPTYSGTTASAGGAWGAAPADGILETSPAAQQPPPPGRLARLAAQPLIPHDDRSAGASLHHARGVGVTATARVTLGGDQHMLAESEHGMTTYRTAIRRRLAVRRAADRPPASGRKTGHGSIVAPLTATIAATLAASVVVGVKAALAKAERERRRAQRARERQFALLPEERPAEGLRRIAVGQLDLALELLEGDGEMCPGQRALLRLLEDVIGERAYARESAAVRDAGRRLAGARDSEVIVSTLE